MGIFDRFRPHRITNENWEFYQSFDGEENPVFTSIDLTYSNESEQRGFEGEFFIRIRMPENKLSKGIPTPEEHDWQNVKEDELCTSLVKNRVPCMQVARLTFGGQKQYVFEYNDLVLFKEVFENWKISFGSEYDIELNRLKAFEYYRDLLPDKFIWQQIGNRQVIDQLISAGSNPNKAHLIEHDITGSKKDLTELLKELEEHDFSLIGLHDDHLEVGVNSSIELDDITDQTDYLMDVSEKHQCTYDGWKTAVVK